jgi:hypothetical protein
VPGRMKWCSSATLAVSLRGGRPMASTSFLIRAVRHARRGHQAPFETSRFAPMISMWAVHVRST